MLSKYGSMFTIIFISLLRYMHSFHLKKYGSILYYFVVGLGELNEARSNKILKLIYFKLKYN